MFVALLLLLQITIIHNLTADQVLFKMKVIFLLMSILICGILYVTNFFVDKQPSVQTGTINLFTRQNAVLGHLST